QLTDNTPQPAYRHDNRPINFGLICLKKLKLSTRKHHDYKLIDISHHAQNKIEQIIKERNKHLSKININKIE
ncbi:MAG: arginine--tRNA ligase, partial [Candidatus Phytoplasma australasiaticum]|nr:arginine--tRNA ligase [Candidatus Phytoplasma australasiaticum]